MISQMKVGGKMILVTGASGYVGSHIVKRLAESGESVRAMVRNRSYAEAEGRLAGLKIDWVEGDVTKPDSLSAALQGVDVVIGLVESHGRKETEAQVRELEVRPGKIEGAMGTGTCAGFIGLQKASSTVDRQDPHCAFELPCSAGAPAQINQAWDITQLVQPIPEAHEIAFTLDCSPGFECRFESPSIRLFVDSE